MSTQARVALTAWSERLISDLNKSDERAKELTSRLTDEQLNWRAAPDTWSIGQCLEHLCIANEKFLPPMSAALAGKPVGRVEEIRL